MFVKIPVYWVNDDYNEDLGTPPKYTPGELIVNTDQICAYHANDNGETMVRLSNAEVFRCPLEFKQFQEMFPMLIAQLELIINTDTNVQ
jgi:hypothetical protein